MKNNNDNNTKLIRSIIAIFWLGFFMAISFMEAPLKFTAPKLSMVEGLQIGKIVFGALNYSEWIFLVAILITCFIKKPNRSETYLIACASIILLLETAWLLPALNLDANRIINGQNVTDHGLHWYYVILEIMKVPILLLLGIKGFKSLITRGDVKRGDTLLAVESETNYLR